MELIQEIQQKERELNNLKEQYDLNIEEDKNKVLKSKSKGFTKSLYLLGFEFESSSCRTPQYLEFHKNFKKEFTAVLKPYVNEIQISKPNHFNVSGFFRLNNDEIYYFSIEDLRWNKKNMLIRTAKDFKDYTGGINGFINLNEEFKENLLVYLKVK